MLILEAIDCQIKSPGPGVAQRGDGVNMLKIHCMKFQIYKTYIRPTNLQKIFQHSYLAIRDMETEAVEMGILFSW